nr:4-coumarate--CoA ligase-like 5 [Tanacetum cinerariifolium]
MDTFEETPASQSPKANQRNRSGFDSQTRIYHSLEQLGNDHKLPTEAYLDTATFVLSKFPKVDQADSKVALIDFATGDRVTYSQLKRSIYSLATGLYHGLGVRQGDVVFVLSPNSILYPTICLAVFFIGGVLTTANPLNTESEINKQVIDSGAKLAIAAPGEVHKLVKTKVPTLLTSRNGDEKDLSVEELIECCEPMELPETRSTQLDTAAILYSSGTTGVSKGVVLTHANFISIMTLLIWSADRHSASNDVFLCFLPMFHIYGLAFFALGLFCTGCTTVLMTRFDFKGMPGYGLTESCGAATVFLTDEEAKAHNAGSGTLLPTFCARVVDFETGLAMPPNREGELWLKSPTVMKGYLGNEAATAATIDSDGWLRTGDLCYFDDNGVLYIVDRIKELIKHNGLQDEEAGEIPMAYVVRASGSQLCEDEVIQFVASQV